MVLGGWLTSTTLACDDDMVTKLWSFTRDDFTQGYWTLAHNSRDTFASLLGESM